MKIALAQLNPTVGDLAGNAAKILAAYQRGVAAGVELVVCPELTITGYPPRDLLLKKLFVAQNLETLNRLAAATGRTGLLVGFVGENPTRPGRDLTNAVTARSANILYVLETSDGWFARHNISTGTVLRTERGTLAETFVRRQ